jgi:hypothetical protein
VISIIPANAGPALRTKTDAGQSAFAIWFDFHGPKEEIYVAYGRHDFSSSPTTWGIVFHDVCRPRGDYFICEGRQAYKRIPFDNFQINPLLESASLTFRSNGVVHHAQWEGRGDAPKVYETVNISGLRSRASVGVARNARASGNVFNESQAPRGSFGFLAEGANGLVSVKARELEFMFGNRSLSYEIKIAK